MIITKRSRDLALRRALPLLMAAMMILTMGFLPGQQAAASGPAYKGASIPSAYQKSDVYNCIDISAHQGIISEKNFRKVKEQGVTHVIIRTSYTRLADPFRPGNKDSCYVANISNAYAAGLKIGAYHYSQAKTIEEAEKEANFMLTCLRPHKAKITLPVVFDWEFGKRLSSSVAKKNGRNYNTKICNAFCNKIKSEGYTPMVYANLSTFNNYLDSASLGKNWKIWLAQYNKTCGYRYPMYMWQYSSSGRLSGISGNVDCNYLFMPIKAVRQSDGTYHFLNDGKLMKSTWVHYEGKKYYVDKKGNSLTGYHKIDAYYYGFDSTGAMYANTKVTIKGKTYRFIKNGRAVLYQAKVKKKLVYRAGKGITKKKKGTYKKGRIISIVRVSGKWVQASNGYWSKNKNLKKTTVYPQ